MNVRARRLLAEALRWAAYVAGLLAGVSAGKSPANLARGAARSVAAHGVAAHVARGVTRAAFGRLCPHEKALASLEFSLRVGFGSLAVPSKLVGVREHQRAVRDLKASGARFGTRLRFVEVDDRLAVAVPEGLVPDGPDRDGPIHKGSILGYVQPKHEVWLRPLLEATASDEAQPGRDPSNGVGFAGVAVCLLAVTGDGEGGRLHGVNVAFRNVPYE